MALLWKKTNTYFLSGALGFSAGVMIYVSLIEILPEARFSLSHGIGPDWGPWITLVAFFGGMFLIAIIDNLVPKPENPHEIRFVEEMENRESFAGDHYLFKMGLTAAIVIAIHNFPEGIATFMSALQNPSLGVPVALAVAIHNIPEGIAVSVPIYFATGSRRQAFRYSFFSGLSEPLGALVGYLILARYLNDLIFGVLFAAVAGIMVFISLDELLPAAREYGKAHLAIYGVISGMFVMAVSLLVFS